MLSPQVLAAISCEYLHPYAKSHFLQKWNDDNFCFSGAWVW